MENTKLDGRRLGPPSEPHTIGLVCGINQHGQPFIALIDGDTETPFLEMSTERARNFAVDIIRTTQIADNDAQMIRYLTERMQLTFEQAMATVRDFRAQSYEATGQYPVVSLNQKNQTN